MLDMIKRNHVSPNIFLILFFIYILKLYLYIIILNLYIKLEIILNILIYFILGNF